ncbi:chloramphenicol phosphotransferase [Vibrio tapetis subsp. quintayensis]|uniref:chloramphenicol phosphotransferase CPT family protein n=1 Tax=Vibrio tapetis TaxID=52443 RepID=UPI0025B4B327|nr:chloramphenicol phosphotransferase [Vibrio tapetis]MDN3681114.1 chloramphenicol phosphotransferase [Vibrio tapetis subsp. quintayensis]
MYPDVILLNGTGSSGKTSVAKILQETLKTQYLNFSIDSVLYALPPTDLQAMIKGSPITRDGYDYANLVKGYHLCLPGLIQANCRLIIDNAWIDKQEIDALLALLAPYNVIKIGVYCELNVANQREKDRGDRAIGLAAYEYPLVHQNMNYDLVVDTSTKSPEQAAEEIVAFLKHN